MNFRRIARHTSVAALLLAAGGAFASEYYVVTRIPGASYVKAPEELPPVVHAGPRLEAIPGRVDLGSYLALSGPHERTIQLKNTGDEPAAILGFSTLAPFGGETKCFTFAPGEICDFKVKFNRSNAGTYSADLVIVYDSVNRYRLTIPVTAEVTPN